MNHTVKDEEGSILTYIQCKSVGEESSETKQYIDTKTNEVLTTSDKKFPYICFELVSKLMNTYGDDISVSPSP